MDLHYFLGQRLISNRKDFNADRKVKKTSVYVSECQYNKAFLS